MVDEVDRGRVGVLAGRLELLLRERGAGDLVVAVVDITREQREFTSEANRVSSGVCRDWSASLHEKRGAIALEHNVF